MSPASKLSLLLIPLGLGLLGYSHYRYGLAAQQGLLLGIVPLLFAGLLLGRRGLWLTAVAYLVILILGSWTDLRLGASDATDWTDALARLLQPVMGYTILALILDRLILKTEASRKRSRDLSLLYRQLTIETRDKEQAQQLLSHSQRIDALGKLAANAAHDFNNLLSVILGYATLHPDATNAQRRLDDIAAATLRGKHLTDKLLSLARADPAKREDFDVNDALRDLLPLIESMLGRHIQLVPLLSPEPAPIRMDQVEFETGVLNLAKNAGDAMEGKGTFRIETAIVDTEVRLQFSDTGCGMTPDVAARVFEPFFTTKPSGHGTGIGLPMLQRIVTESGGRIMVDSTPGKGSCFTLQLPLSPLLTSATGTANT